MKYRSQSPVLTYPDVSYSSMLCLEDGQQLEKAIEELRNKMYKYISKGASKKEILQISQQLDEKLNELDELKRKGKGKA
ncbi:aspartyl-phosphate phosphatase Spo0E family protein [Radiobacillus deserti]|uniref:Aspartyl-phosphate phosphatase Spo0E family protein n=1 Tax=Radiobacillus deserti TaxID=2594883 RepID=A0A516KF75_9BACI|nr:aspartyl-phosphate phosphatase Spo0E family protein [Radiobacillus deserti]QDP39976.1 aspartyl-phosphate phosphatase Spo0E family protein [Radiobacillus deserti]